MEELKILIKTLTREETFLPFSDIHHGHGMFSKYNYLGRVFFPEGMETFSARNSLPDKKSGMIFI